MKGRGDQYLRIMYIVGVNIENQGVRGLGGLGVFIRGSFLKRLKSNIFSNNTKEAQFRLDTNISYVSTEKLRKP